MVAITRNTGIRRSYALLTDAWPAHFSLIVCHEGQMRVQQETRDVIVAYLNHNLSPSQRRSLLEFLIRYDQAELCRWCEDTTDRLILGDLDAEWLQDTNLVQKLKNELGIQISLIFNFTPDENTGPIQADEQYPLSIVFSRA